MVKRRFENENEISVLSW